MPLSSTFNYSPKTLTLIPNSPHLHLHLPYLRTSLHLPYLRRPPPLRSLLPHPALSPISLSPYRVRHQRFRSKTSCEQDADSNPTESTTANGDSAQPSSPPPSSSPPSPRLPHRETKWWKGKKWQWRPIIQVQEIRVLLLQLGVMMFAMRLLRPGIPLPGSEPRPLPTYISVPFSDFLSKISKDEVQKVEVDGVRIMFKLRGEEAVGGVGESEVVGETEMLTRAPTKRVVYTTMRPGDIKTPYEKMLENQVEFGSPDKQSGGFLNSALMNKYRCTRRIFRRHR